MPKRRAWPVDVRVEPTTDMVLDDGAAAAAPPPPGGAPMPSSGSETDVMTTCGRPYLV